MPARGRAREAGIRERGGARVTCPDRNKRRLSYFAAEFPGLSSCEEWGLAWKRSRHAGPAIGRIPAPEWIRRNTATRPCQRKSRVHFEFHVTI